MRISCRGALRGACLGVAVALAVPVGAHARSDPPWYKDPAVEHRAHSLLARMSLAEKVDLLTGQVNANYGFYNNPNQRLGIPAMQAADGPVGGRGSAQLRGGRGGLG